MNFFRLTLPEPLEGVFSSTGDEDYDFFEPLPRLESGYVHKCAVLCVFGEDELAGTSSVVCLRLQAAQPCCVDLLPCKGDGVPWDGHFVIS